LLSIERSRVHVKNSTRHSDGTSRSFSIKRTPVHAAIVEDVPVLDRGWVGGLQKRFPWCEVLGPDRAYDQAVEATEAGSALILSSVAGGVVLQDTLHALIPARGQSSGVLYAPRSYLRDRGFHRISARLTYDGGHSSHRYGVRPRDRPWSEAMTIANAHGCIAANPACTATVVWASSKAHRAETSVAETSGLAEPSAGSAHAALALRALESARLLKAKKGLHGIAARLLRGRHSDQGASDPNKVPPLLVTTKAFTSATF
jgi:hypothetical protein